MGGWVGGWVVGGCGVGGCKQGGGRQGSRRLRARSVDSRTAAQKPTLRWRGGSGSATQKPALHGERARMHRRAGACGGGVGEKSKHCRCHKGRLPLACAQPAPPVPTAGPLHRRSQPTAPLNRLAHLVQAQVSRHRGPGSRGRTGEEGEGGEGGQTLPGEPVEVQHAVQAQDVGLSHAVHDLERLGSQGSLGRRGVTGGTIGLGPGANDPGLRRPRA